MTAAQHMWESAKITRVRQVRIVDLEGAWGYVVDRGRTAATRYVQQGPQFPTIGQAIANVSRYAIDNGFVSEVALDNARQAVFYAMNDRTIPAGP